MGKFIVLGSSCAVPGENNENTHLALIGQKGVVLIDCAAQPVLRLRKAGIHFEQVTDLILTHFHPDHVYGAPMFLMESWLRGRKQPLNIFGLPHCIDRMVPLMIAFDWDTWPNLFPISFLKVDETIGALVLDNDDFRIESAPVKHFVPTMGLRITDKATGHVLGYSCDTEPCPGDYWLASGVDMLIHEATGKGFGHASAAQAGEVATQTGAKHLVLIHYVSDGADPQRLIPEAQATFNGPVTLAQDFMTLEF